MITLDKLQTREALARTRQLDATTAAKGKEIAAGGKTLPASKPIVAQPMQKRRDVDQAMKNVAGYVQNVTRELNFSVDEELDKFVVKVLDQDTGELIRQIPTEEMINISKNIEEIQDSASTGNFKGILFQGEA